MDAYAPRDLLIVTTGSQVRSLIGCCYCILALFFRIFPCFPFI